MDMDLSLQTTPDAFGIQARFDAATIQRDLAQSGDVYSNPTGVARLMLGWQEIHATLLKAILDELVKARTGIRT